MSSKGKVLVVLIIMGIFIGVLGGFRGKVLAASDTKKTMKLVTSVKIEEGDTLWSIAAKYITPEYKDIRAYIKEIKKSNGLSSDTIYEGGYLIIPYYQG